MPTRLNHKDVATHYLEGNIKLLSTYVNSSTKNDLECLICSHKWQARYGSYSSHGDGCPKCGIRSRSQKKSNKHEDVAAHYLSGNIRLLSQYVNNRTKNNLECLECGHKWQARYGSYSSKSVGCPNCAGNAKHNHEDIAKHYLEGGIKLLNQYVNTGHKNSLECLKCGHQWKQKYTHFISRGTGCPNCFAQTHYAKAYKRNKAYSIIDLRLREKIAQHTAANIKCFYDEEDLKILSDPIEFVYRDCPKAHHVDHIIPFNWFDVFDPDQMAYCWHFLNLQYLPATKNIVKKDNITPQEMKQYLLDFPLIWMIALKAKFLPDSMRKLIIEAIENQQVRLVA